MNGWRRLLKEYSRSSADTLHLRNLLHLGEDRYFTTLLSKHFMKWKRVYDPSAKAENYGVKTFKGFLTQRRRWWNSAFHNSLESLSWEDILPNVFPPGLRLIAIIDLFGTTVRPAAGVAFVWLVVQVSIDSSISAKISISICLGAYALHGILLILKRQWGYIGWMLLNLIAFPFYFFFLPIYCLWKQDDFDLGGRKTNLQRSEEGAAHTRLPYEIRYRVQRATSQTWQPYLEDRLEAENENDYDTGRASDDTVEHEERSLNDSSIARKPHTERNSIRKPEPALLVGEMEEAQYSHESLS